MLWQSILVVCFFGLLVFGSLFLVARMLETTRREKLASVVIDKTKSASARANSAILSVENAALKNAGRGKKRPFDTVNWFAMKRDLMKAGLPASPLLIVLIAALIASVITFVLIDMPASAGLGPSWLPMIFAFPPVFYVTRVSLLGGLVEMRKTKAMMQLMGFIESVQRAVTVGTSPEEAVLDAIKDAPRPLKDNLLAVKELIDLGYDFIDAINLAADRIDLKEFDIFVVSLSAQASTGGTIGDVPREVVEIIRSRIDMQRKVATMTAEGRFNALLLGSVPIGLVMYLRISQPDYFNNVWTPNSIGPMIFFATIGLSFFGAFLAVRISSIKV